MQNSTTATRPATDRPVQNSFFEPVQTSLFQTISAAAATEIKTAERSFAVHCDICSETDSGTSRALEGRGWGLYGDFEFCPIHEEMA